MTGLIAGHDFDSRDQCKTCSRTWFHIMHVTRAYIGAMGYAHYDGTQGLTETEYLQIERRRIEDQERAWQATRDVATGSGPARALDDEMAAAEAA